jgi:ribose 5-phosphate isomerase A
MTGMPQNAKQQAAEAALKLVEDGMKIGLGTGSTAYYFVEGLARRVAEGLTVQCVPTSEATRQQAEQAQIPLCDLDSLGLIKGGGAALLREKIVAAASDRMIVIADQSKLVDRLGAFALPVEVNMFSHGVTARMISDVIHQTGHQGAVTLREKNGQTIVTDGGHYIYDCALSAIAHPEELAAGLNMIPGVVEHGLFINLCAQAFIADGVQLHELTR